MRIIILGGFRNTLAQDFGAHFLLFPWFYFSFWTSFSFLVFYKKEKKQVYKKTIKI
jgi:hypothetical protein